MGRVARREISFKSQFLQFAVDGGVEEERILAAKPDIHPGEEGVAEGAADGAVEVDAAPAFVAAEVVGHFGRGKGRQQVEVGLIAPQAQVKVRVFAQRYAAFELESAVVEGEPTGCQRDALRVGVVVEGGVQLQVLAPEETIAQRVAHVEPEVGIGREKQVTILLMNARRGLDYVRRDALSTGFIHKIDVEIFDHHLVQRQ